MYDLIQIQQVLQEKQQLLQLFEEETQEMLTCPSELLEEQVRERQKLINLIEDLDQKLDTLIRRSQDAEPIREAISGRRSCESLPEGMESICNAAIQIRVILSRLRESDLQAAMRLRLEQEHILKRIKSANQGVGAKAARFYSVADSSQSNRSRLGNA